MVTTRTFPAKFDSTCPACGCKIKLNEMVVWSPGAKARHETAAQCAAAKQERAAAKLSAESANPSIDLTPLVDFLKTAQTKGKLKSPKLRVLALDGKSELQMALTKGGTAPGSLSVVLNGTFIGCVRPTGSTTGALAQDVPLQEYLLRVARDPVKAAQEYGALMGKCSFCGLQLTDEGSVEVGYGPICAKHWGLPHSPKGTKVLTQAVPF